MPIDLLDEQQKLRQIGEIRIGQLVQIGGTDRRGKPRTMPKKLDKFRFTSPSKPLLEEVAKLYGGEVQSWQPANGGPAEWELFSTVDRLPVLVRGRATTEWFELYDGPRCVRKCTGSRDVISGGGCLCDPDGNLGWWDNRPCKPTTRLMVMLQDVPAIGEWLVVSRGRNAAETLPPMARFLAQANGHVPALLGIEERITYPSGDKPPNRFMVPILEVFQAPMELIAGRGSVQALAAAGGAPDRKAIGAGSERPDYVRLAEDAPSADAAVQVYFTAKNAGHLDDELDAALRAIGSAKRKAESPDQAAIATAAAEEVEAEIVEDEDEANRLLSSIAELMPDGWDTSRLNAEFARRNAGVVLASGSVSELREYRDWLKGSAK